MATGSSKGSRSGLGDPVRSSARTWIPISWQATGPSGLFPVLDGDLELATLGAERTQLAFSARYRPPLGLIGRMVDRALLSRVAEATIKDFVEPDRGAAGRPDGPGRPTSGKLATEGD